MAFVQQKFSADCGVACLAMFLKVDYEEVAKHCTGYELVKSGLAFFREERIASKFEVNIVELDISKIDKKKPAILEVPSKNSPDGCTHVVYWDGKRIWDPNDGIPGRKKYSNQESWSEAISGYQRVSKRKKS